jgi:hypothetical protein
MKTLKRMWEVWKRLGKKIGNFQARVLLTIFYAVLMFPFGIGARLLSDPLRIKRRPTEWLPHSDEPNDIRWARGQ